MKLEADNLEVDVEDDTVAIEPGYVEFLRSQGYRITDFTEPHSVASESTEGKGYLVGKVHTHIYPWGDPRLDVAEHGCIIPVCSCWQFRQQSADVSDGQRPNQSGVCSHIKKAYKEYRAANDESQATLE